MAIFPPSPGPPREEALMRQYDTPDSLPEPLYERVLVRLHEVKEKTTGGIYLPSSATDPQWAKGTVVAVGSGQATVSGVLIPLEVHPGDTVQFNKRGATPVAHKGETLWLVERQDLHCKWSAKKAEPKTKK